MFFLFPIGRVSIGREFVGRATAAPTMPPKQNMLRRIFQQLKGGNAKQGVDICKGERPKLEETQEQLPLQENTTSVPEKIQPKEKTPNREELRQENERDSSKIREVESELQQMEITNLRQPENTVKQERDEKRELQQESERETSMRQETEQQLHHMEWTLDIEKEEMRQQSEIEQDVRRVDEQLQEESLNQQREEMRELRRQNETCAEINMRLVNEQQLQQIEETTNREEEMRELRQQSEREITMRRETEQQLLQMEETLNRERGEIRELRRQSEIETNKKRQTEQLLEETVNREREEMRELRQQIEREMDMRRETEQQLQQMGETLIQEREEMRELQQQSEREMNMRRETEQQLQHMGETLDREREDLEELRQQSEREMNIRRETEQLLEEALNQEREEMRELRQQSERERNMRRETEQERNAARARVLDLDEEVEGLRIQLENERLQNEHINSVPDWVIGREEVQLTSKILGAGAWATVSEGIFRGSRVAVKKIHELIISQYNVRLFEREMTIASRCRHPNLLQFIGATRDNESPLFVMEILDTSLRSILHERDLVPAEFTTISLDVARALNYLHLNRPPIIHRDLSSANVLLWQRGIHLRGKVSDYGTANFTRQCRTRAPGAAIYSAPEALTEYQSSQVICLNKCIVSTNIR